MRIVFKGGLQWIFGGKRLTANFEKMAKDRELLADKLTDLEIWRGIILKVINLDVDSEMKVEILVQSIPDIGTIFGQLKFFNSQQILANKDYYDLLEICIRKYEKSKKFVDFNPLKYKED